jgi:aminocarboxymuconate-semialdehyde decarboxylase
MRPIVDAHAHWYSDEVLAELIQHNANLELQQTPDGTRLLHLRGSLASHLPLWSADFDDRLRLMDELGIGVQVLSAGALDVGWAGEGAAVVAGRINDLLAEVYRARPERFRFLATLPLGDREAMLGELERARGAGAVGIGTTTTYGGRPLDAPEYRDFWRAADAADLPVAVHPCFPLGGPVGDAGTFLLTGFIGETTMAATRLVLSGVLEECPKVRVIWGHVGGALPMIVARLDAGYRRFPTCPRPVSEYLRRCYYDAVCSHGPALECARETFGSSVLLFGTDEPHRLDQPADILRTVMERPWPSEEIDAVLGGTAAALFGLSPGETASV